VAEEARYWLREARGQETVIYFAVYFKQVWIGGIVLHDFSIQSGESLIAYHLFDPCWRNQGIGTRALSLLVGYVQKETALNRLVIITSKENTASQKIAMKNGFRLLGSSREDPLKGMVFEALVQREPHH
jgi:RimJ/RimL family protein N-acetyltransferase